MIRSIIGAGEMLRMQFSLLCIAAASMSGCGTHQESCNDILASAVDNSADDGSTISYEFPEGAWTIAVNGEHISNTLAIIGGEPTHWGAFDEDGLLHEVTLDGAHFPDPNGGFSAFSGSIVYDDRNFQLTIRNERTSEDNVVSPLQWNYHGSIVNDDLIVGCIDGVDGLSSFTMERIGIF